AFRNLHFDVTAVDGEVHRRAEDRITKSNGQLGVDVGAARRHFFESAAEEIGKDVREAARRCAAAAAATRSIGELREIKAGKWIRSPAAERERFAPKAIVLLAFFL